MKTKYCYILMDALRLLLEILMIPVAFLIGTLPIIAIAVLIGLVSMLVGCGDFGRPMSQAENDAYWREVDAYANSRDLGISDSSTQSIQARRLATPYWRERKDGVIVVHGNACKHWIGIGERAWKPLTDSEASAVMRDYNEVLEQAVHKQDFSHMKNVDGTPIRVHCSRVDWWQAK